MSEYQYLEFLAVDRPLTAREMDHLRGISTRAWKSAHEDANKGHAHAYDAACRQLIDLRDAYSQHATLAVFQKEFQKYMAEHSRRRALVQRLVNAGLWRDK